MATKKFMLDIPLVLHDMVQDFVVSALSARPSNYVDYAVEYYLHLQTKDDPSLYEITGDVEFKSGTESDELFIDSETVSDTANAYHVTINPDAFQSPIIKQDTSDDEDSNAFDFSSLDGKTPRENHLNNQSLSNLQSETESLSISTSKPLPSSPPFVMSQSSFSAHSNTNSFDMLPISSPVVSGSSSNLSFQTPLAAASTSCPVASPNNTSVTSMFSTPLNSVNSHLFGDSQSSLTSPFKTPHLNSTASHPFTADLLLSHQAHLRANPSQYNCKSCKGAFKPHPRVATQSLWSSESPRPPLPSSQELPDRQLYSLFPTSHLHSDLFNGNGSPAGYYPTAPNSNPGRNATGSLELPERKYHCPICEKSYKSNTGLKRHLIVHTGERPYQCQYCFKSFFRKYVLTTHISRVHSKLFEPQQPSEVLSTPVAQVEPEYQVEPFGQVEPVEAVGPMEEPEPSQPIEEIQPKIELLEPVGPVELFETVQPIQPKIELVEPMGDSPL